MAHNAGVFERNLVVSEPPANCLDRPVILGIDEAGRGPVMGPMTYACAYWSVDDDEAICKLGFNDSKQLKESTRDSLFSRIKGDGRIGYAIDIISPEALSAWMLQRVPVSLNAVSHESAMNLIRIVLDKGVRVAKVFVDTVGDPGSYQAKLQRSFSRSIEFTVCSKADSLYKTVSAASICAKVTRDKCLREWVYSEPRLAAQMVAAAPAAALQQPRDAAAAGEDWDGADPIEDDSEDGAGPSSATEVASVRASKRARTGGVVPDEDEGEEGVPPLASKASATVANVAVAASSACGGGGSAVPPHPVTAGSGYPGDPAAKRWLTAAFDRTFGWPSVVRFSWATAKDRLEAEAVPVEWEEGAGAGAAEAAGGPTQAGMASFFSAAAGGSRLAAAAAPRPAWYRKRHMRVATSL